MGGDPTTGATRPRRGGIWAGGARMRHAAWLMPGNLAHRPPSTIWGGIVLRPIVATGRIA